MCTRSVSYRYVRTVWTATHTKKKNENAWKTFRIAFSNKAEETDTPEASPLACVGFLSTFSPCRTVLYAMAENARKQHTNNCALRASNRRRRRRRRLLRRNAAHRSSCIWRSVRSAQYGWSSARTKLNVDGSEMNNVDSLAATAARRLTQYAFSYRMNPYTGHAHHTSHRHRATRHSIWPCMRERDDDDGDKNDYFRLISNFNTHLVCAQNDATHCTRNQVTTIKIQNLYSISFAK